MSKPKKNKNGSKSKKRIPARKKKPTCARCHTTKINIYEIKAGYCYQCQQANRMDEMFQLDSFPKE